MLGELEREDRPAFVRFERRPVEDAAATLKAGRSICKDIDYALVTPPYSKDCVEYKVTTWKTNLERNVLRKKVSPDWVKQWMAQYDAWKEGNEAPVNGTDIRNWSVLSPAQVKNVIAAGCRTVEDLAQINDQGLRYIGMGANELKKKANTYLQAATDHGPVVIKNAELERENAQLKGTIESLQSQMNTLSQSVHTLANERLEVADPDAPAENVISMSDIVDDETPAMTELNVARQAYREKFGKNAHPFAKLETINKKLKG